MNVAHVVMIVVHNAVMVHLYNAEILKRAAARHDVCLVALRIHERRFVRAHHGLDALLKLMRPDLNVGSHVRNIIERQVQGRRQAFVEADVVDVVVDHIRLMLFFLWGAGASGLCGVPPSTKGMVYLTYPFRCQILPQNPTFGAAKGKRWMNGAFRCR